MAIVMQDASLLPKGSYLLTKYALLSDVAVESPRAAELLTEYGLHCANCFANGFDTLENGAKVHGMSDQEMEEMIDEINEELAKANE